MEKESIKIPTKVHKELKVFTAQHDDNMIDFAGFAIPFTTAIPVFKNELPDLRWNGNVFRKILF